LTTGHSAGLLRDALRAIERCRRFLADQSFDDYLANDMLGSAVERQLEIIGEALSTRRRSDPTLAAKIPDLQRAVRLTNVLIHGYASVDHQIVGGVVQLHLRKPESCLRGHLPPDP